MGFGGIAFHAFGVARCKIGHGKTAVVGFAVETAVNLMMAAVAGGRGGDGSGHLNAGEGRPLRSHSPGFNFPRFAHLAYKHVIVDDKGQHTVRRGLIEHLPAAGGAEAKAGIVGKFCVLFRELSVAVPLVDTGGIGRPARRCTSILAYGMGLSRSNAGMGAASADQKGWSSGRASNKKLFMPQ